MFDVLMTEEQKKLREEVRDLVKSIPRQILLDMDADKISFPTQFLSEAGKRNLLGLRFPKEWGGRGLTWDEELIALDEIATLGICFACQYSLVSIVGETLHVYGTDAQKEKYLKPTLAGKMFCAEALTEPRGGSDFFGGKKAVNMSLTVKNDLWWARKAPTSLPFTPRQIPMPNPMSPSA